VVLFSQGASTVPAGLLFTVAFRVADDLANGTMTDVIGLTADNAIDVPDGSGGVTSAATSASDSDGNGLTFGFEDSVVEIGCEPPATPTGVAATQNRSDGVLVTWDVVATTGAEYRVYRNTVNNAATAVPLGDSWQSNTTYLDITANVPVVISGDGCNMPDMVNEVHYFYWVQARTADGCQGSLSAASAEGFRVQAKALAVAALFPGAMGAATPLVYGSVVLLLAGLARRRPPMGRS
jgi:hypothetical protein